MIPRRTGSRAPQNRRFLDEGAALALDPISLARTLIDIPSTTGEELGVSEFLEKTLTEMGFTVTRQEVVEGRFNLLAVTDQSPSVILCSHTDTVPPFIPSTEDDDFIYGRGACDTKGIIADRLGKPLLYGPGSILDAHGSEEKIAKREILQAVETYRTLVSDLLSGKAISIDVEN